MPRSRSLTRLTMRVGLLHLGQSVDFVVSITFWRSPVFAIFAMGWLVLLLGLSLHTRTRLVAASTARSVALVCRKERSGAGLALSSLQQARLFLARPRCRCHNSIALSPNSSPEVIYVLNQCGRCCQSSRPNFCRGNPENGQGGSRFPLQGGLAGSRSPSPGGGHRVLQDRPGSLPRATQRPAHRPHQRPGKV